MKKNYTGKFLSTFSRAYKNFFLGAVLTLMSSSLYAQFPAPYCAVTFPSNVEPITRVQFAGINNTSSGAVNGTPALEDFTSVTGGTVEAGASFPIVVQGNTVGDFTCKIVAFFDWNHDGDFADAQESFNLTDIYGSTGTDAIQSTGTIAVPPGALAGSTRMRIVKRFLTVPGPCNTAGYGQAEDYVINVVLPTCPSPSSPGFTTLTAYTAMVNWTANGPATNWTVEYGVTGFTPGTGMFVTSSATSKLLTGLLPNTTYQFYVTSICSPTDSSINSQPGVFTTTPSCPRPTSPVLTSATTTTANLDWVAGGTETAWTIEYGVSGFTVGTGTFATASGASETILQSLTPNTFYQAYITAICTPTDSSVNSTVINFNTYGFPQYMEADTDCGAGFTDIRTTGTLHTLGDDAEVLLTLPFPFYFQGTMVTTGVLGNNGGILFVSTVQDLAASNDPITGTTVNGVYPLWDDIATAGAGVFSQTIGTAPNRKMIVQWNKRHYSVDPGPDLVFQVIFDEATAEIFYNYSNTITGNATYNNGASATIGIAGPNQDIQLSYNNAAYLTNNTCAHFYYTDCPKPTNLVFSNITNDEFSADWNPGISNETEWTVEYGVTGFTPGTGTILTGITASEIQIPNLTQLTTYDVYIYASCSANDSSVALVGTVQTLPFCTNPYGLTGSARPDSLLATWSWTPGVAPLSGFNIQYGPTGFDLYSSASTTVAANGMNFADTVYNAALMAGMSYQVYVQAVCGADTSNFVGPITVTMPLTNDLVCAPEALMTDGTVYTFSNAGATVSNGTTGNVESSIAPPATGLQMTNGWGNSTLSFTTWFTFTAPPSGQVRISGKDAGFDGQIAVYKVGNCAQFSTFELIAANDNEIGGTSLAPNFTVCGLIPGSTYYLLHDSYSTTATGIYSIKITPIVLEAGTAGTTLQICTGSSVSLFDGISGNDAGGVWTPLIPSIALEQDSIFNSNGLAYQTFQFKYKMTDGCAKDSIISSVRVFPPSTAGTDGSLVICRNQPINLYDGLTGIVDMSGTWYTSNSTVIPNGNMTGDPMPGQYIYTYVVGNGVCPNDTSKVTISVQACNYLGLEEAVLEGFSLYPNPTEGLIYIKNDGSSEVFNYEVLDLNGRIVMKKENAINGSSVTEINLNGKENGIYMIRVFNASAEKTFRVVVK